MAISLARRLARRPDEVDDLVQVALIAAHADRRRQARLCPPDKQKALAWTTLRRAMYNYNNQSENRLSLRTVPLLDDDHAVERQDDLLELEDYFSALERQCGPLARRIAENLVSPDETCTAAMAAQVARKRRCGRYSPRAPRARLSQKLTREALGIGQAAWSRELLRVREFTRDWLDR